MTEQTPVPVPLDAPRLSGWPLKCVTRLAEWPLSGGLLARKFLTDVGIERLRSTTCHAPLSTCHPLLQDTSALKRMSATQRLVPEPSDDSTIGLSAAALVAAYAQGSVTPVEVVERAFEHAAALDEDAIIVAANREDALRQAALSLERYRKNAVLGPLDGVPVAIKDELDVRGYHTRVGTRFLGSKVADTDATVVERLRRQGAVIFAKLNMHEIGIGVTGINPHFGAVRNPYDTRRMTGGSSSGSGAAIAAGLCPIAIGADGGGSIRIPAALCGVVGLKATFGRISEFGAAPLCWSVGHVGPMGLNVSDVAMAYQAMAGPDDADPQSGFQPPVAPWLGRPASLNGLRIGVDWPYLNSASSEVAEICSKAIHRLEASGATIRNVNLPNPDLVRSAHMVTIVSEMLSAMSAYPREQFGYDVRLNLALAQHLKASDYVKAQRLRTAIYQSVMQCFEQVDVIVKPATAITAPVIDDNALTTGLSDLSLLDALMRFAPLANLTGLPALSLTAGYDHGGLPIGLQCMGRPWDEGTLLDVGAVLESQTPRQLAQKYRSLLDGP